MITLTTPVTTRDETAKSLTDQPALLRPRALHAEQWSRLIFNTEQYNKCLHTGVGAVSCLKNNLKEAAAYLNDLYWKGAPISQLVLARAWFTDQILVALWRQHSLDKVEGLALLAVGGYGRAELLPHSDIDLLILLDDKYNIAGARPEIEKFVTALWDLSLDIGHSVRTVSECVERAHEDITIATNLLETRLLAGNETLSLKLYKQTYTDAVWTDREFFAAKRDEQLDRHQKYGDTQYNLEPNLKTSPGSLRDIQTIGWITKRHFGYLNGSGGTGYEFLTDDEMTLLREGEIFLWQLRYGLHIIAGRNENRLLFDYQKTLADMLHYQDTEQSLGVEQMMQRYYRNTLALRELNDVVLQHYEEVILHAHEQFSPVRLNRRFQVKNNYIEAINNGVFAYQPFALMEIFLLIAQNPAISGIRASTIRSIRAHRHLIDEDFRKDITNTSVFMEILRTPHALHKTLSAMKCYGVLGQYLPEFGSIIGKMQYDLFHVYTVDVHTEHVVRHMVKLQRPEGEWDCPLAARLAHLLPKPELLYIAGLYHDIGKGRGGDHSVLGAVDAEHFCQRHHLSEQDTRLVCWLVQSHLLMSMTAQRKDISDPEIIHEFADHIESQVHLNYLYVLTVSDINATNPKLWNNWRAALLRQLYNETRKALRTKRESPPDRDLWIQQTRAEVKAILISEGSTETVIDDLWNNLDDDYFLQDSTREIARQAAIILRHKVDTPLVCVRNARDGQAEGFLQVLIFQKARSGQFAVTTTTLENLHLNIHDARVDSFSNTHRLSNYIVSPINPEIQKPLSNDLIEQTISKHLHELNGSKIVIRRTPRQLKHFSFPTEVSISYDLATQKTVLELLTPDRSGLLARIASVFLENHIDLVKARIATLGERVEDVFVITDNDNNPLQDPHLCQKLGNDLCDLLDAQNEA